MFLLKLLESRPKYTLRIMENDPNKLKIHNLNYVIENQSNYVVQDSRYHSYFRIIILTNDEVVWSTDSQNIYTL